MWRTIYRRLFRGFGWVMLALALECFYFFLKQGKVLPVVLVCLVMAGCIGTFNEPKEKAVREKARQEYRREKAKAKAAARGTPADGETMEMRFKRMLEQVDRHVAAERRKAGAGKPAAERR